MREIEAFFAIFKSQHVNLLLKVSSLTLSHVSDI